MTEWFCDKCEIVYLDYYEYKQHKKEHRRLQQ